MANDVTSIIIDSSCKTLAKYSLNYSSVTNVTIPTSVTTMEDDPFYYTPIKELYLPQSLVNLSDRNPFNLLPNVTNILVDLRNPSYASFDGVIYTKDLSNLVDYPRGRTNIEYTLPKTVKNLSFAAFNNPHLEIVKFEDCIEFIGYYTFHGCTNLKKILTPLGCPNPKLHDQAFIDMSGFGAKNLGHYVPYVCRFYPISCDINPYFNILLFAIPIHVFILL